MDIYKDLGFEKVVLKYADRPEVRVGEDKVWDKAEASLLEAVKATKLEYSINKGEGAFYGPKIEFVLRDAIGRDWQCGTVQVDLKNHNLNYKIREHSLAKVPVLLICGKKEVDSNSVTIRRLDSNKQENMELNKFLKKFSALNKASSN